MRGLFLWCQAQLFWIIPGVPCIIFFEEFFGACTRVCIQDSVFCLPALWDDLEAFWVAELITDDAVSLVRDPTSSSEIAALH